MYDTSLRLASDWLLELEALATGECSYKPIKIIIDRYERDGATMQNKDKSQCERKMVLERLFPDKVEMLNRKVPLIPRIVRKIQRIIWKFEAIKISKYENIHKSTI